MSTNLLFGLNRLCYFLRLKKGGLMTNGKKCIVCKIAGLLVVIGAINWGLVGAFQFNLVDKIFGEMSMIGRIIYVAVGLSGLIGLFTCLKECKACCKTS